MLVGNLCTVEQVKLEGQIKTSAYDEDIAYKITDLSEDIREIVNDPTLTSDNKNARKCCIYGVLEWLEQKNVNINSQNVSSIKEGDKTVSYANNTSSSSTATPKNYTEEYNHYLSLLLGGEDEETKSQTPKFSELI